MPRPLALAPYFRSIRELSGVGPRMQPLLRKLIGGECLIDLLLHAPTDVIDRGYSPPLNDIISGDVVTLKARVGKINYAPRGRPSKITCHHKDGDFDLVYFNASKKWLEDEFINGREIAVSGKAERYKERIQIVHPDIVADMDQFDQVAKLEPVYPLTQGVTSRRLHGMIDTAIKSTPNLDEWIGADILKQEQWPSWRGALETLHDGALDPLSLKRLAYDEALAQALTMALRRAKMTRSKGIAFKINDEQCQTLRASLPYQLTGAQERTISEIDEDMIAPARMLRLIQGDVGSGKTIVAFMAMLTAVSSGYQAAIMAPTDILANQHVETMKEYCDLLGLKIALVTGRQKDNHNDADIIIGTHALFQDKIDFDKLGLVIIDEQHRFGVEQRLKLSAKGAHTDVIVMTATPIPRSLTLAAYGDMDVSRIDEKPPTRKPVQTALIHVERMEQIVKGLHDKVRDGQRAFWVCPLVEESEKVDLAAAEDRYIHLEKIFGDKVGLIHGRMKGVEKDAVMAKFASGQLSVLVSTTVIEVGVNIPEATIMIIEQAERFGLAQLHQLRGRVGRGDMPATCLLLYRTPISQTGRERLKIMRDTEDGFIIAEKDLELRGGGEMLGTRQSGLPNFRFLDLQTDTRLMEMARQDAHMIIDKDIDLKTERGEALRTFLYLYRCDNALSLLGAG